MIRGPKIVFLRRKMLAAVGCIAAAFLMCWVSASPKVVGAAATERQLPIYCVQKDYKVVSLTFDAAWGNKDTQKTERLIIAEFTMDMAEAVHLNSLDEDNRRFVPDEVFETVEEAADTVGFLMSVYENGEGPLVYPVLLKDGTYIGYVQAVPFDDGTWEVGYHIGSNYTRQGYAAEAVKAFLAVIMPKLGISQISGICLVENKASVKVMERCGFIKEFEGVGLYQGEERNICKYVRNQTSADNTLTTF